MFWAFELHTSIYSSLMFDVYSAMHNIFESAHKTIYSCWRWLILYLFHLAHRIVSQNMISYWQRNLRSCAQRGLTAPFVDDGLLEVVGFRDAWQGALLFTPNGHGVRLAQVGCASFSVIDLRLFSWSCVTCEVTPDGSSFVKIPSCVFQQTSPESS
jgi:hypothetical protein